MQINFSMTSGINCNVSVNISFHYRSYLNCGVVCVLVANEEGSLDGAAVGVDDVLAENLFVNPVSMRSHSKADEKENHFTVICGCRRRRKGVLNQILSLKDVFGNYYVTAAASFTIPDVVDVDCAVKGERDHLGNLAYFQVTLKKARMRVIGGHS
jgi:hypothetical protein